MIQVRSFRRFRAAAFTLAEAMVAIGLFGITAAAGIAALTRINNNAVLCRLQTGASTVAQNQIDLILSDGPFNPQKGQVPPELTIGTTYQGSSTNPTVPVYTDPSSGQQVLGWMSTGVADTGTMLGTTRLYIYQATVTVFYNFKGRLYSVSMCTLRSSDT
jgi:type II secretory pathway pseudopilin PulG